MSDPTPPAPALFDFFCPGCGEGVKGSHECSPPADPLNPVPPAPAEMINATPPEPEGLDGLELWH